MIKIKLALKFMTPLILISYAALCAASQPAHQAHSMDSMDHNNMNHAQHETASNLFGKRENSVTQLGENGHYNISLFCNNSPIPMRKIHNWTIHIETPDGKPVENAKIYILGVMPMHNHEFPTVPRVKEYLGNGDYRVEGVKFSMIGHWEMHFNVEKDDQQDRVVFKIHM